MNAKEARLSVVVILVSVTCLTGLFLWEKNNKMMSQGANGGVETSLAKKRVVKNITKPRTRMQSVSNASSQKSEILNKLPSLLNDYFSLLQHADEASMPDFFKQVAQFSVNEQDFALTMLTSRWAALNPVGAAQFSQGIEDTVVRGRFMTGVLSRWPKETIGQGFAWIEGVQDRSTQSRYFETLIGRAINIAPELASNYIGLIQDNRKRLSLISDLAAGWAHSNFASVLAWAEKSLDKEGRTVALAAIGKELAKAEPLQAVPLLEMMPFGSKRTVLLQDIAERLFSSDVEAARNWLYSLDIGDQKKAIVACSSNWAKIAPEEAANFGIELGGSDREKVLTNVMKVWGSKDPVAAVAWVQNSGQNVPPDSRQALFNSWASSNVRDAAAHIQDVGDNESKGRLLKSVAVEWTVLDPQAAAKFADELPDAQQRLEAVSKVAIVWASRDSLAASQWIANLEQGPVRDRGVAQLANAIINQDPESAFIWTLEISNPIERARWIKENGNKWIEDCGETAISKIRTLGLSPVERNTLNIK